MDQQALKRELVVSGDGSHTIRVEALKEHYHSHKGALAESRHVFIQMGLHECRHLDQVRILEVGFGTGLNALLTLLDAPRPAVHYIGLELYPVEASFIEQLNYGSLVDDKEGQAMFMQLHEAEWNKEVRISDDFVLNKRIEDVCRICDIGPIDLIYYDAFAPHAQPELWEDVVFATLFDTLRPGGKLVTYCAKGDVRRAMQSVGFDVERLPGPPGKREMLRARKP